MDAVVRDANAADESELICGACGQNLRGVESNRCPECGVRFDPSILTNQLLPWEQRRQIGWLRAYFRTARWVCFQPSRICGAMRAPVSRRAAMGFRAITVLIAWLMILLQAYPEFYDLTDGGRVTWRVGLDDSGVDPLRATTANPVFLVVTALSALAALALITGTSEYFLRSRKLDSAVNARAGALSQYACAPLVWLLLFVGLLNLLLPMEWQIFRRHAGGLPLRNWDVSERWLTLVPFAWFVVAVVTILRRASAASVRRCVLAGITLPILWIVIATVCLLLPHLLITYIVLLAHRN